MTREAWLNRIVALLEELQPELGELSLDEETRLGEDLGLDSLAFEALFSRLRDEVAGPVDPIVWFNALEADDGRIGTLLDLLVAAEPAGAPGNT